MLLGSIIFASANLFAIINASALYLVNCQQNHIKLSGMAYYDTSTPFLAPTAPPDAGNFVGSTFGSEENGGSYQYVTWEGQGIGFIFPTNTVATSNINDGAQSYSEGQPAGYAENNWGTGFACYKDNGQNLFDDGLKRCDKIYYCLSV